MRTSVTAVIAVAAVYLLLAAGSACASEDLAKEFHCMGCHSVKEDKAMPDKYGPYFTDIAEKYQKKGNKEVALALLEESIMHGSKNKWDRPVNMEPRSECGMAIDEENAKKMAAWIMTLAPESSASEPAKEPAAE